MPDPRFYKAQTPLSVKEAILLADASLIIGDDNAMLTSVAAHDDEGLSHTVIFCSDAAYLDVLASRDFGLCLVPTKLSDSAAALDLRGALAVAASPRLGFARIADRLYQSIETTGVMARSDLPADAEIDETAVIDKSAKLGAGLRLGAHVSIGPGVSLGDGCLVNSGVSISHAEIGNNAFILGGARIGQAGFGFEQSADGLVRVPQLGRVLIGDDVEIGANSTIDRGALGDTIIGQGTKIDNLVQIGHNTRIGKYCVFAAQTGISGSCIIGDGVFMGGQVGLKDHLTIGDGAQIAAGSGLMRDVPPGEKWGGSPARPVRDWLREISTVARLARKKNG